MITLGIGGFWCYRYMGRRTSGPATRPGPHPQPPKRGGRAWKLAAVGAVTLFALGWYSRHCDTESSRQRPGLFAQWRARMADAARERALADAQRNMSELSNAAAHIQSAVKALEAMARSLQQPK